MTVEKMNIHRALSELKVLDDRIMKKIGTQKYLVAKQHSFDKVNGIPVKEYIENTRVAYQSILDLIHRRAAMRRAVMLSNAKTLVQVAGPTYTVAEAIEMKNHGMELQRNLLSSITSDYSMSKKICEKQNAEPLEERTNDYIRATYGNVDLKGGALKEVEESRQEFIKSHTFEIVDPIGAEAEIRKLSDEIDTFMAEVDAALSVSNAITEIEFSY